jgi:maltose O-acetyltransferase
MVASVAAPKASATRMAPRSGQAEGTASYGPREDHGGLHLRLLAVETMFRAVPPFVFGRLRTYALRAAGIRIGRASVFWGTPTLVGSGAVCDRLSVGAFCGFNKGAFFDLEDRVTIGDHVAVGHDVMFLTRTHHSGGGAQRAGAVHCAPVTIENGVWLGARCTIMPGVTVGAGSVVGASVTVTADVPPNTLLMGTQKVSLSKWR